LFKKYNYPEADEHIIEHKQFFDTINMFDEEYSTGGGSKIILLRGIYSFLFEWIFNHIKVVDKKYARFLKDNGLE
jgi:hemerythrin-like metal-binding protein